MWRDTLAYEIAAIQSELGYPGLMKECNALIVELRLADIRCKTLSKLQWKKVVSKAIIEKNLADLLDNIARNYKKLDFKNYQQKSLRLRNTSRKTKLKIQE